MKLKFQKYQLWILFCSFLACLSCSEDIDEPASPDPVPAIELTIDSGITYQTISGFGGANQMWGNTFPSAADMQKAFGTGEDQLGLSIFRVRIPSNRNEWSNIVEVAREAKKYDAKILASPWSPPAELKSNGSDVGGYLLKENYDEYLKYINDFIEFMASNDVDIYAISIQNEPDIEVGYESSDWTSAQMADFLRDYGAQIEGAKVAAAESFNFNRAFTDPLLNEDAVAENIDIVAGHIYGNGLGPYPLAEEKGKEIWMTEYLMNQNATDSWAQLSESVIWNETLGMLKSIHEAMKSNWNAYIWWYLKRYYSFIGDGSQGTTSGEILKRGYAFSHFSRFIRPGYQRIKASIDENNLLVSAYKGDNKIVVELINTGNLNKSNISVSLTGEDVSSISKIITYTTSSNLEQTKQESGLDTGDVIPVLNVEPKSITTLVIWL